MCIDLETIMIYNHTEHILLIAEEKGILHARDLRDQGIPNTYLGRMVEQGLLEKVSRGLYRLPDGPITEFHTLVTAAAKVPQGVVCLLSALSFHDLTTQIPFEIWMALENKAWAPKKGDLPIRYVRSSGEAFTTGVEEHEIEGLLIKIYNPAKTVADCFKYRNKIGVDIAIEALRDGFHKRKFTVDELMHYARICRVHNVMRPYLEATI